MYAYRDALNFVLKWEGGFVDDPDDRGGRTNKGVTQGTYDIYLKRKSQPPKDVLHISEGEVADIYRSMYWKGAKCDLLRDKLAFCHFDTAVNMGPRRAVRIVQRATGCAEDGIFGPATQKACEACDLGEALISYCEIRGGLYRTFASRPKQQKFLRGWMNRLNSLRRTLGLPVPEGLGDIVPEPTARISDLAEGIELESPGTD